MSMSMRCLKKHKINDMEYNFSGEIVNLGGGTTLETGSGPLDC